MQTEFFIKYNGLSEYDNSNIALNDYGVKYPVDIALFALIIPWLFKIVRKQRKNELPTDPKISERIARELYKIIRKNKIGEFIKPITNESVKVIELSPDRSFQRDVAKIDDSNFEDYLGIDTEILPELEDGKDYKLNGEITSLKSTRGDSLTFQYINKEKEYNLDLFPPSGKTTKEFTQYYKENVEIAATVERYSLYKKPKLHLMDISFKQQHLDFIK